MSEDKHDWVPIAWWDKTTESIRIQHSWESALLKHLEDINPMKFRKPDSG